MTENVSREKLSADELGRKIYREMAGMPLNRASLRKVESMVQEHVKSARRHGIDFPDMTVIPLRGIGSFQIARRDHDAKDLQVLVWNLYAMHPLLTEEELAWGIEHAYPGQNFPSHLNLRPRPRTHTHAIGAMI